MRSAATVIAVILALVILAGGYFLSSFSAPYYDEPEALPATQPEAPSVPETPEPDPGEVEMPTFIPADPEDTPEDTPEEPVEEPEQPSQPGENPEEPSEPGGTPEEPTEPAQEPEQPTQPAVTDEEPLDSSFFDDAAFIGDSISGTLEYHGLNSTDLGKATYLVTVDYSVKAAVENTRLVVYKGRGMSPQDALKAAGVSKVYIMLGAMGDIANNGIDKTMENWAKLIANIKEKNPDIRIFIQSCTPIAADTRALTNQMINDYNERLREFAAENGLTFVEIGEHFKDKNGCLPYEHCRDGFAHLRIDSAKLWVEQLKDPANYSISPREA